MFYFRYFHSKDEYKRIKKLEMEIRKYVESIKNRPPCTPILGSVSIRKSQIAACNLIRFMLYIVGGRLLLPQAALLEASVDPFKIWKRKVRDPLNRLWVPGIKCRNPKVRRYSSEKVRRCPATVESKRNIRPPAQREDKRSQHSGGCREASSVLEL